MLGDDAAFILQTIRAAVGNALNLIDGVSLAVAAAIAAGVVGFLGFIFYRFRDFISTLTLDLISDVDTGSQWYSLVSYCCDFHTVSLIAQFYYFTFCLFVLGFVAVFGFWAGNHFIRQCSAYIYSLVSRSTGA